MSDEAFEQFAQSMQEYCNQQSTASHIWGFNRAEWRKFWDNFNQPPQETNLLVKAVISESVPPDNLIFMSGKIEATIFLRGDETAAQIEVLKEQAISDAIVEKIKRKEIAILKTGMP